MPDRMFWLVFSIYLLGEMGATFSYIGAETPEADVCTVASIACVFIAVFIAAHVSSLLRKNRENSNP